jgi:hypothetical protein
MVFSVNFANFAFKVIKIFPCTYKNSSQAQILFVSRIKKTALHCKSEHFKNILIIPYWHSKELIYTLLKFFQLSYFIIILRELYFYMLNLTTFDENESDII